MEFQTLIIKALKLLKWGVFHRDLGSAVIYILVLSCTFFSHATCVPCFISEFQQSVENEECGYYMNYPATSLRNTLIADVSSSSFESVCTDSSLFCFPSTLRGGKVDGGSPVGSSHSNNLAGNKSWSSDYGMFELYEGGIISCSLNSRQGVSELFPTQNYDSVRQSDLSTCRGDLDQKTNSQKKENLDVTNSNFSDSSMSPYVDVSPAVLDWGQKFLYLPSFGSITVTNTCNESILQIYEPFSTDSQFYACNFSEALLGPGEAVSIYFVFLPRYLGLSSAHLILQTSFGGFLVQAKGFAVQSPYGIQPLLNLTVSSRGRWTKNLSLFNPFDDVLYVKELSGWISVSQGDTYYHSEAVCSVDRFHVFDESKPSIMKDGLVTQRGRPGSPLLSMRPYRQWKIDPHRNETILEVDLSFEYDGTVIGTFWLQLLRLSQDKPDVVVVPLEAELEGGSAYDVFKGSVSASIESLLYHENVYLSISLKNSASRLLSVLKITEVAESKVFQFKSLEGLLLFPGTVTQVALITCNEQHVHSYMSSPEILNVYSKCKLLMLTNESSSSQIEVPCQDLFLLCSEYCNNSFIGNGQLPEHFMSGNIRTGFSDDHMQLLPEIQALVRAEADELVLENWVSMGTTRSMSVLDEHEVFFSVVEVGRHCTKWITVKNPSKLPVVMQLIINSGEIIDECRDPEGFIHLQSGGVIHNDSITPRKYGFSLAENARTEAFVHPHGQVSFGPIFFYPSDRCHWRSSILIRNNLSGVEWLSLSGNGGSLSLLLLEGSKPVDSIEFEFESTISLNNSPSKRSIHMEEISHTCTNQLSKDLYAKNTGDFPLEVKKIKISGTDCTLDGFTVHNCKEFSLEPGESKKLMISYQTEFSTAVVYRDLELALATGILVIPMKASFPLYMLKSTMWAQLKKFTLDVLIIASVTIFFFRCVFPHLISLFFLDYFLKSETSCISSCTRRTENTISMQYNQSSEFSDVRLECERERTSQSSEQSNSLVINSDTVEASQPSSSVQYNQSSEFSDVRPEFERERESQSSEQSNSLVTNSETVEASQPSSLMVKTGNERRRRRKKKKGGGMNLTGLYEVSSSQSGNSTPSSPLSPTASRRWPVSPDVNQSTEVRNPFAAEVVDTHCRMTQISDPVVTVKNCTDSLPSTPPSPLSLTVSGTPKRRLPMSPDVNQSTEVRNPFAAEVVATQWRKTRLSDPVVTVKNCTDSSLSTPSSPSSPSSPLSPTASGTPKRRLPVSRDVNQSTEVRNLLAAEVVDTECRTAPISGMQDKYKYDIWGDHSTELHPSDKSKDDAPSMTPITTDNNSDSFFETSPHKLFEQSLNQQL